MRTEREFLVDVLRRLNQAEVDYMLTGAMASSYWGVPRTTHGADFVLALKPIQAGRFVANLGPGFFAEQDSTASTDQPPLRFRVADEQSALKADFWPLFGAVFEQACFDRRLAIELWGTPAWITTAEDILLHKLHWNQVFPSDWHCHDVAGIYAVQADRLDLEYLRHWTRILKVERDWKALVKGDLRPKST